jgi:hypothetical protein
MKSVAFELRTKPILAPCAKLTDGNLPHWRVPECFGPRVNLNRFTCTSRAERFVQHLLIGSSFHVAALDLLTDSNVGHHASSFSGGSPR